MAMKARAAKFNHTNNSRIIKSLLLLLAMSTGACSSRDNNISNSIMILNSLSCPPPTFDPPRVEIDDVLKQPAKYDETYITVSGKYNFGFEISAIYPATIATPKPEDGLWLHGVSPSPKSSTASHDVIVTGKYRTLLQGHLAKWPGGICVSSVKENRR
ncbi:hypothetical protein [Stenotrophomonas sp. STM01]|uniref:hypothetical protein n=1 Tax=Stenotrophomonas sp. STM01 TaxID=2769278 RepID=UPI00177AFDF4|nr:hypothetical protein [Stenotrophomonas sp. STM01]